MEKQMYCSRTEKLSLKESSMKYIRMSSVPKRQKMFLELN